MGGSARRTRAVTRTEAKLWRAVVRDATPLPGRALPPEEPEPEPVTAQPPPSPPAATTMRPAPVPRPATSLPYLSHGHAPGLDRRNADRLRRGQLEVDGRIDLHGMTQEAAHSALAGYLSRCWEAGRRCVLVITGKGLREGTGILRAAVPRWLNEPRLRGIVLAFSHAQPRDGGEGALYVLLKRRR